MRDAIAARQARAERPGELVWAVPGEIEEEEGPGDLRRRITRH